ncbi:TrmB family transcriptional regulator [Atlantibacter hermannii]|uniref:TrmB family transcriptional regulator n=1 Tax=Atlantibacter hermannii TaxID=565 RepID=UPI0028B1F08F|nr:TrmB family transcriptional regulator [Atlantibacter hermannii]
MQNQLYMTEEAKAVYNELSSSLATAGDIAEKTHLSLARCQFILTQLVMAKLSVFQFGCYKRLQ